MVRYASSEVFPFVTHFLSQFEHTLFFAIVSGIAMGGRLTLFFWYIFIPFLKIVNLVGQGFDILIFLTNYFLQMN